MYKQSQLLNAAISPFALCLSFYHLSLSLFIDTATSEPRFKFAKNLLPLASCSMRLLLHRRRNMVCQKLYNNVNKPLIRCQICATVFWQENSERQYLDVIAGGVHYHSLINFNVKHT